MLSIIGIITLFNEGESILTTRNHGFLLPAIFIIGYILVRGSYILFFRKPSEEEVKDYVQELKDKGKLPKNFDGDRK